MKPFLMALAASSLAAPAVAQDTRELSAHVHGVSTAEIAIEGRTVEINILSPGMDIVGFEYAPSTAADKDAVDAAVRVMLVPENIVTLPADAACRVAEVLAHLHSGDHDHDEEHAEDDHSDHGDHADHEDHEDHDHDDHGHEDHADEDRDHDHGDHDDHADEDHDHDHAAEKDAAHSEFHARYVFDCDDTAEVTTVGWPFFDQFAQAQEIEVQFVTATGAGAAEVTRAAPVLELN